MSQQNGGSSAGGKKGEILCNHREAVTSLAEGADGRFVISGSLDHSVCLCEFDPAERAYRLVWRLKLAGPVTSVALDRSARWLAVTIANHAIHVFDIAAREVVPDDGNPTVLNEFIGHHIFSPDSKWLTVCGHMPGLSALYLGGRNGPREALTLLGESSSVILELAISPDSRWIAAGASDGTVRVWPLSLSATEGPSTDSIADGCSLDAQLESVFALEFSVDGKWLFASGIGPHVCGWQLHGSPNEWRRCTLKGRDDDIVSTFRISYDSQWLVAVGSEGTGRLWNLRSDDANSSCRVLRGHEDRIKRILISPNCQWIVTTSVDQTIRLWTLQDPSCDVPCTLLHGPPRGASEVNIDRDSRWLVAASGELDWDDTDTNAFVWDLSHFAPNPSPLVLAGHGLSIVRTAFVLGGQVVVTASCDGTVRQWPLPTSTLESRAIACS